MEITFVPRHINLTTVEVEDSSKVDLPYLVKVMLRDSLDYLVPKNDTIFFDLQEKNGMFAAYVDLDQFEKGVGYSSRYIVFKANPNGEADLFRWVSTVTYMGSNVIDKGKVVDLLMYVNSFEKEILKQ